MKKLLIGLTGWRVALTLLAACASLFLPYKPSFPYAAELLEASGLPAVVYSFANFDGVHYLTIVQKGYVGTGLIQAFFPLYPIILALLSMLSIHPIIAGQFISTFSLLGASYFWVLLFSRIYSSKTAYLSVVLLILFPTSFFFTAVYTEALFLLLVVLAFWFAAKKQWLAAGLVTLLATATRLVGIFLVPALLIELYHQGNLTFVRTNFSQVISRLVRLSIKNFTKIFTIAIGCLGILSYMGYLSYEFGDPLYFYHVQSEFGGGREERIILLPQVFWRYLKIMLTYRPIDFSFLSYLQEYSVSLGALAILIATFRKVRLSHAFFGITAFILPTLTGTLSSMPRYVLICFPLFIGLAQILEKKPRLLFAWIIFSTILLILNTVLFIQGYWVA